MPAPLVSIVIPIYKVEEFLPDCLESAINQSYQNLEIICVNDGSPDRCGEILDKYAAQDKRIKVINQPNGGLSAARNHGLREASGEYVLFIDSDDWISTDCVEKLLSAIEKSHADVAGVHDILSYYSPQKIVKDRILSGHSEGAFQITPQLMRQMWVVAWGKLYRRQQLSDFKMAFPEGYIYEDEYFHHVLLPNLHKIVIADGGAYYYRQRENSIMSQKKLRSGKDNLEIFERIFKHYRDKGLIGRFDLPVRILSSGFVNNENPEAYFSKVKELICRLELTEEMLGKHELMRGLFNSRDFRQYCRCESCYRAKQWFKKFRKRLFRLKVGRKTHIELLGLVLLHRAKGEQTVFLGVKL